jgi:hypothetical protein
MNHRHLGLTAIAAVLITTHLPPAWAQSPAGGTPAASASTALATTAATTAALAPAAATDATAKPVVAVVAAVGDRIGMVRQRKSTGSHIAPYSRRSMQVPGGSLNMAVLKGLDEALELEEPDAEHVLMAWNPPEELAQRLEKAAGSDREKLLLAEVLAFLKGMPERAKWSRVELVVPYFASQELNGLGTRLSGVGIYIQPLTNERVQLSSDGNIEAAPDSNAGTRTTVNPNDGSKRASATYIAPYFYFERLTLDAQTLNILKRQRMFEHTKYADPESTAVDPAKQVSPSVLAERLVGLVERAAFKSVRGEGQVEVGPVRAPQTPTPQQP